MPLLDDINRVLRDFERYTGDGKPGAPSGAPLPTGDPSSGAHNLRKHELRELLKTIAQTMGDPSALDDLQQQIGQAGRIYSSRAAAEASAANLPPNVEQIIVREGSALVIRSRTAFADDPLYPTGNRWGVVQRQDVGAEAAARIAATSVAGVIPLANVGGTPSAITADIAPALPGVEISPQSIVELIPGANNTGAVTLNVGGAGAWPVQRRDGSPVQAGDIRKDRSLLLRRRSNAWRMIDVADSEHIADPIRKAQLLPTHRPGDTPWMHSSGIAAGDPYALAPLTNVTVTGEGAVARIVGAGVVSDRHLRAMEPDRQYGVRFALRRAVNPPDPAGDAVRLAIAWYNRFGSFSGTTALENLSPLTTAMGRQSRFFIVSRLPGDDVVAAPAGAVYGRPFIQTYGAGGQTDVEVIDWEDVTGNEVWSPDVGEIQGRVVALESLDVGARLGALEVEAGTSANLRFASEADAAAASIPASVNTLEIVGVGALRRSQDGYLQTADGSKWEASGSVRKSQFSATRAPLPTDDETQGYAVGSRWIWQGQEWLHAGEGRWVSTVEVTPQAFGARGDGVANDTAAIQAAINWLRDQGGGTLRFPAGAYLVRASAETATFWNVAAPFAAGDGCLIVWPGVSLVGPGSDEVLVYTDDPRLTVILQIDPNKSRISGLEISGGWTLGQNGAGHGIFTLASTANAIMDVDDCEWSELTIRNVASYAIGLQNGNPTRCTLRRIRADYTGADALDLKARGGVSDAVGNTVTDVVVTRHGNRVTGAAGIDCRGLWHVSCVTVRNFGHLNPAHEYVGIRFRTKPPPTDPYPAGERGSLSQFYIDCSAGTAAGAGCNGVEIGSDDVTVQGGFIRRPRHGVFLTGNANGVPERSKVVSVTVVDAVQYSFFVNTDVNATSFVACVSVGAVLAGWRNAGINTSIQGKSIGDTAPISTATLAAPTEIRRVEVVGGSMAVANDLGVRMIGPAANIDLELHGKGSGGVVMRSNGQRALTVSNAAGTTSWVNISGGAPGSGVTMSVSGADPDIDIRLVPKGSGRVRSDNGFRVGSATGVTGSFTSSDGKTVTVTGGIITGIA